MHPVTPEFNFQTVIDEFFTVKPMTGPHADLLRRQMRERARYEPMMVASDPERQEIPPPIHPSPFQGEGLRAFSLVELSIVLVILGLLVGGILAGQSLIHAAELRSISADITKIQTATAAFRDKYQALPGDIGNATAFWGAFDGSTGLTNACINSVTSSAGSTLTCNGNANGVIGDQLSGCGAIYERFRFWQHLANAGLMETNNLTGVYDPAGMSSGTPCRPPIIGSNIPRSRIQNAGFHVGGHSTMQQWNGLKNRIYFGTGIPATGTPTELYGPAITTEDAWNIDKKIDDGMPYYGTTMAFWNGYNGGLCITSSARSGTYDLAQTGIQCNLAIDLGL